MEKMQDQEFFVYWWPEMGWTWIYLLVVQSFIVNTNRWIVAQNNNFTPTRLRRIKEIWPIIIQLSLASRLLTLYHNIFYHFLDTNGNTQGCLSQSLKALQFSTCSGRVNELFQYSCVNAFYTVSSRSSALPPIVIIANTYFEN